MDHLGIGFIACLIPASLALVSFIVEVAFGFWRKYQDDQKKLKEFKMFERFACRQMQQRSRKIKN
jgi:hypothetical protein